MVLTHLRRAARSRASVALIAVAAALASLRDLARARPVAAATLVVAVMLGGLSSTTPAVGAAALASGPGGAVPGRAVPDGNGPDDGESKPTDPDETGKASGQDDSSDRPDARVGTGTAGSPPDGKARAVLVDAGAALSDVLVMTDAMEEIRDEAVEADARAKAEAKKRAEAEKKAKAAAEKKARAEAEKKAKAAAEKKARAAVRKAAVPPQPLGPATGSIRVVACPGGGSIEIDSSLAPNLEAMLNLAWLEGVDLCGSGYRHPETQVQLRRQNCGTSQYAVHQMAPGACSPPTARPGTSNHEQGLAVDFRCAGQGIPSRESPGFSWLAAHAPAYGMHNLPSEPWHWSVSGR